MQYLQATLEKLIMEAEDCALIAKVAPNQRKREMFERWPPIFASWLAISSA